jgi:hypothetical protein
MPAPWRRGVYEKVEYVVVERDSVKQEDELVAEKPTATTNRPPRVRRQDPSPTDGDYDSDSDEDDYAENPTMTAMTTPSLTIPSRAPEVKKPRQCTKWTNRSSFSLR